MDSRNLPVGEDDFTPIESEEATDLETTQPESSVVEEPEQLVAEQQAEEEVEDFDPDAEDVGASDNVDDDEETFDDNDDGVEGGLKRGDLIEGTVLKTSPTEILVDLGEHGNGIINSRELERLTSSTLQGLQEGMDVLVYVLTSRNEDGLPVLSISRALEESDWRQAEEYLESKEVYHGKVAGYNKGGLIVRFGRLRGFVPASQISQERRDRSVGASPEERWGNMLGESVEVKVVELKRSRNRLILSEQAAVRDIREREKSRLLDELEVGEQRTGYVTSLTDFGAFVDLGGADGLVHLTELSWKHVTHPNEVIEVGQKVDVEVISVDRSNRRIGLSMRRTENDPWSNVEQQYVKGQLIQASITKLTKFGAFARLVDHPEIEGLIHVSELSEHRVRHPREVVSKGDVLTLRIIKIDREQRRLGLSLKQVDSPDYMDIDWRLSDND
jgi:small subunit ribosomal protein S1